jgi:hypothetical protein
MTIGGMTTFWDDKPFNSHQRVAMNLEAFQLYPSLVLS